MYTTKWTGWVGWIAKASEDPSLGSWVTHPLSVLPGVPTSHLWNKHQKPCKPCTKQDMWNQTWYQLHFRATLFHNYWYTIKQSVVMSLHRALPWLVVTIDSIDINWIKQPGKKLLILSYNHNTLTTLETPGLWGNLLLVSRTLLQLWNAF